MRKKNRSFLRRIASGGVLAAGVALLFATGCDLALDEEIDGSEEGLVETIDDDAYGEELGPQGDSSMPHAGAPADGDLTAVCHFGPLFTQEDSDDLLLTESELPAHIGHGDVFGTCADFFCGAS